MKAKIYFLVIVLFSLIGNINATVSTTETKGLNAFQPPRERLTPEERAKRETETMKTELVLTDTQIPAVDSINLKYAKKQNVMREEAQGDFQSMRTKMTELRNQKNEELKKVLTKEQMDKYIETMAQRRNRMGGAPQNQ